MTPSWINKLQNHGQLNHDVPMSAHTTLQIGGVADYFFKPHSQQDLIASIGNIPAEIPIMPLGRGSNLLVHDLGIRGVVLDLGNCNFAEISQHHVTAQAGVRMGKLSQMCANHGLTGLEFMATVPGDLGGGVAMNAGAFGQQLSDHLLAITLLNRQGTSYQIMRQDLKMSYRHTQLPQSSIILSAEFELPADEPEEIRQRMRGFRQKRSATQPLSQPNCGSVFKNPPGDFSARLIEAVGLKGHQIGQARISSVHANFIVNEGGATSADVRALIALIQMRVAQQFSITLEPEVRFIDVWQGDDHAT
ncbi:MAG: UDP-N-acetylmuramate dehydrogenase [Zetaproteobacteria bacterium]|nr:UDP-N-acetylmuramate dehydrogenase [Zetaproteobacteria bacterium]